MISLLEQFHTELDPRRADAVRAIVAYATAPSDRRRDAEEQALLAVEGVCACVAMWHRRVSIPEERWREYDSLTSPPWNAELCPPDYCQADGVARDLVQRFLPNAKEDVLVRRLVTRALQRLHERGALELWPNADAPQAYRATVALVASYPELLPLPQAASQSKVTTATPLPGQEKLNTQELAVVSLLRRASGAFVLGPAIQQAHGTNTTARAVIRRIREKWPGAPLESAQEAWNKKRDPSAANAKGYRWTEQ